MLSHQTEQFDIPEPHALPESGSARPAASGVVAIDENYSLRLFPNPTSTGITLTKSSAAGGTITLYDLLGTKVKSQKLSEGKTETYFDSRDLTEGMYLLLYSDSNGLTRTYKITKIN